MSRPNTNSKNDLRTFENYFASPFRGVEVKWDFRHGTGNDSFDRSPESPCRHTGNQERSETYHHRHLNDERAKISKSDIEVLASDVELIVSERPPNAKRSSERPITVSPETLKYRRERARRKIKKQLKKIKI